MRTPVVIKADPIGYDTAGVLQGFKPMAVNALVLERSEDALDHAVLLGTIGRDELLQQTVAAHQRCVAAAGEHKPLSERCKNCLATRPKEPQRAIKACSSADSAVLERPLRLKCQPNSSRVWQSITSAKLAQPSCPVHTRHRFRTTSAFLVTSRDKTPVIHRGNLHEFVAGMIRMSYREIKFS